MTTAGDRLARANSSQAQGRVARIKRGVASQVLRADWRSAEGMRKLVDQLSLPLLVASGQAVIDYVTFANQYAVAEGGPAPATPVPQRPSEETEGSIIQLAALGHEIVKLARRRAYSDAQTQKVLAVAMAGRAARVAMGDRRDWERRYLTTDRGIVAYRRVPDAHPCHFCAMLASRGWVYRSARSAGDPRVVSAWHDSCGCTSQPNFGPGVHQPKLDAVTRRAQEIYESSTAKYHGKDKARAFRRAWEESK